METHKSYTSNNSVVQEQQQQQQLQQHQQQEQQHQQHQQQPFSPSILDSTLVSGSSSISVGLLLPPSPSSSSIPKTAPITSSMRMKQATTSSSSSSSYSSFPFSFSNALSPREKSVQRETEIRLADAQSTIIIEREARLSAESERVRLEEARISAETLFLKREQEAQSFARRERELRIATEEALHVAETTALAWDMEAEKLEKEKTLLIEELNHERATRAAVETELQSEKQSHSSAIALADQKLREQEARLAARERQICQESDEVVAAAMKQAREAMIALDAERQAHIKELQTERAARLAAEDRAIRSEREAASLDGRIIQSNVQTQQLERSLIESDTRIREMDSLLSHGEQNKKATEKRLKELESQLQEERSAKVGADENCRQLHDRLQQEVAVSEAATKLAKQETMARRAADERFLQEKQRADQAEELVRQTHTMVEHERLRRFEAERAAERFELQSKLERQARVENCADFVFLNNESHRQLRERPTTEVLPSEEQIYPFNRQLWNSSASSPWTSSSSVPNFTTCSPSIVMATNDASLLLTSPRQQQQQHRQQQFTTSSPNQALRMPTSYMSPFHPK